MPSKIIGIRVSDEQFRAIDKLATAQKVKPSAYCYAVLCESLANKRKVIASERPVGLAAADAETRSEVGRIGRASEGSAAGAGRKKSKKID